LKLVPVCVNSDVWCVGVWWSRQSLSVCRFTSGLYVH